MLLVLTGGMHGDLSLIPVLKWMQFALLDCSWYPSSSVTVYCCVFWRVYSKSISISHCLWTRQDSQSSGFSCGVRFVTFWLVETAGVIGSPCSDWLKLLGWLVARVLIGWNCSGNWQPLFWLVETARVICSPCSDLLKLLGLIGSLCPDWLKLLGWLDRCRIYHVLIGWNCSGDSLGVQFITFWLVETDRVIGTPVPFVARSKV